MLGVTSFIRIVLMKILQQTLHSVIFAYLILPVVIIILWVKAAAKILVRIVFKKIAELISLMHGNNALNQIKAQI